MKKTSLLAFLLLFPVLAGAQATTIMKVSAEIVSGAKTEIPTDLIISQSIESSHQGEVMITSSPFTDIDINTSKMCTLTNDFGEKIQIKTDSLLNVNPESGLHTLSVSGLLPLKTSLSGQYRGAMVTTVEYL